MLYPIKRHLKYQELQSKKHQVLSVTKILSASTAKMLEEEKFRGRFLKKKELGVASFNETARYKILN